MFVAAPVSLRRRVDGRASGCRPGTADQPEICGRRRHPNAVPRDRAHFVRRCSPADCCLIWSRPRIPRLSRLLAPASDRTGRRRLRVDNPADRTDIQGRRGGSAAGQDLRGLSRTAETAAAFRGEDHRNPDGVDKARRVRDGGAGSEKQRVGGRHRMRLTYWYWMAQAEVTQGEFLKVTGANPGRVTGSPYLPVDWVAWDQAAGYCRKLTNFWSIKPTACQPGTSPPADRSGVGICLSRRPRRGL